MGTRGFGVFYDGQVLPAHVRQYLDMKLAIHRLFTLLWNFDLERAKKLAQDGIFNAPDLITIRCQFCEFHAPLDSFRSRGSHSCKQNNMEGNYPLPDDPLEQGKMRFEAFRLLSLLKYRSWNVSPYELAKTGLYKCGGDKEDKCICYICRVEIFDWKQSDDPKGEHKKHFKGCPLLQGIEENQNIPIGRELESAKTSSDAFGNPPPEEGEPGAKPIEHYGAQADENDGAAEPEPENIVNPADQDQDDMDIDAADIAEAEMPQLPESHQGA